LAEFLDNQVPDVCIGGLAREIRVKLDPVDRGCGGIKRELGCPPKIGPVEMGVSG